MKDLIKYNRKPLNSKTPQWFKDWHGQEFLPIKIRQDILIAIVIGILIALFITGH